MMFNQLGDKHRDQVVRIAILWLAVPIYWLLCHRIEDRIAQKPEDANVGKALRLIRRSRYFFTTFAMGLCIAMVETAVMSDPI